MKPEYNLGWGDPIVVRQALTETLGTNSPLASIYLSNMGYPPHIGNSKLIEQLKEMAYRQSGHKPKHLIVTCGATGAINAALYALKDVRTDWVITDKRYYPFYPQMIFMADMIMVDMDKKRALIESGVREYNFLSLSASPSAPEGNVCPFGSLDIWDAAYASSAYTKGGHVPNKWRIMTGSLSKTLGLSGLRLGWASTDEDLLADSMTRQVTASTAGLSSVSQGIAEAILDELYLDQFENLSRGYLDDNRGEIQKLLDRFGQGNVPSRGMFAVLELGKAEKRALERANVKWQPGESFGADSDCARLSLGQSREITKAAVKAILK